MTGALHLAADTKAVLVADAVMFLVALLLGVWKYRQIMTSESFKLISTWTSPTGPRCSTALPCC